MAGETVRIPARSARARGAIMVILVLAALAIPVFGMNGAAATVTLGLCFSILLALAIVMGLEQAMGGVLRSPRRLLEVADGRVVLDGRPVEAGAARRVLVRRTEQRRKYGGTLITFTALILLERTAILAFRHGNRDEVLRMAGELQRALGLPGDVTVEDGGHLSAGATSVVVLSGVLGGLAGCVAIAMSVLPPGLGPLGGVVAGATFALGIPALIYWLVAATLRGRTEAHIRRDLGLS